MHIILGIISLLVSTLVFAGGIDKGCTQQGKSACIDWEKGIVIAEGLGAPSSNAPNPAVKNLSAIRAARLDASRNLLEMIKKVNLSSSSTMKDAMIVDDTVRSQVKGMLTGLAPIGKPRYFSDGSVKVRMQANLRDTIPEQLGVQATDAPKALSTPTSAASAAIDTKRVYTGLVIDAKGTDVQPAMSPKVFDEEGKEVYGSAYVERRFVLKHGMVGYVKDIGKAQQNDRVKGTPLQIKALKSSGKNSVDLVISNADANALRTIAQNQSFLKEARVMFVLE